MGEHEEETEDRGCGIDRDEDCANLDRHTVASHLAVEKGGRTCSAVADKVQHSCAHCGQRSAPDTRFQKCARCLTVRYCSADCQKLNWKTHKKTCRAPRLTA